MDLIDLSVLKYFNATDSKLTLELKRGFLFCHPPNAR